MDSAIPVAFDSDDLFGRVYFVWILSRHGDLQRSNNVLGVNDDQNNLRFHDGEVEVVRIIDPKVELIGGNVPHNMRAKHVELCGRVCYKSEDKITDDSAEKFIAGIIKRGNEAVLEHARVTLNLERNNDTYRYIKHICDHMKRHGIEDYIRLTRIDDIWIASANMRAWRAISRVMKMAHHVPDVIQRMWHENEAFFPDFISPDDEYIFDPVTDIDPVKIPIDGGKFNEPEQRLVHSWYTFRFICDRGISHEIVRHRPASYCQESTRYCDYSKGQFGGEITVIKPFYLDEGSLAYERWYAACTAAERCYFDMRNAGCTPQEARAVLPTSLKTELVMTATADEWCHFLNLRCSEAAHPQMREVATRVREILIQQDGEVFGNATK